MCTDGTNVNTGKKTSLWTLMDKEMEIIESEIPLLKIWCAAHRAELVWKDTAKKFKAVGKVLSVLSGISYFHQFGLRASDLEQIGADNNLITYKLPKFFEIRRSQFSFTLLRNVFFSWKVLLIYFERNKKDELLRSISSRRKEECFPELRKNIVISIRTFLDERFETDETLFREIISPFICFETDANIRAVHEKVAPDLSLPNLSLQFQEILNNPDLFNKDLGLSEIIIKLSKTAESREKFREIIIVLSRIAACTPHSADVERCISSNNRLKTKLPSSLKVETENKYLFIHYNMPDLQDWKPSAASNLFLSEKMR